MSMAIDKGARGESVFIAMRLTFRNGGSGGTRRSWCRYVMASAVAILVDSVREAVVIKLLSGSIIVQNFGQR
jgi:hypothetical protein